VFADFLKRYPDSDLVPEAQLAVARTYIREGKLDSAIQQYDAWVARFTNNPARSQAEFDRAWLNYEAGSQSNAVNLFTNYVAHFPNSTNAPLAQYLVGSYYFDQGDLANAELNYKILMQNTNWPVSDLTYQASMMAGRAAFARGGFGGLDEAKRYFLSVINFAPPDLQAEAYFFLGDTVVEGPSNKDSTNPLLKYTEAISIFSKIPPTNHLSPRALGRKADCYLQLATQDAANYEKAVEFYTASMTSPLADPSTRSQAEVGLGLALEKQAQEVKLAAEQSRLLDEALNHFMNVVYGPNLRDGEHADPYWFGQAGLAAGRLLEKQQKWDLALKVYEHLVEIPALRTAAQTKLAAVRSRMNPTKN
jgi:tetratricopeptide (TPR) repeat protein